MDALREYLAGWPQLLPFIFILVITAVIAPVVNHLLLTRKRGSNVTRQFIVLVIVVIGFFGAVLAIPMSGESRRAVLSLLSIGLTAIVAMSSTTIVSNFMAGLMLRLAQSFHPGDFILVDDQFGRVTELNLLHTEIQTDTRDLATIPNSLLVSSPVMVTRSSGTIVTATISLGYDVPHTKVEELLVSAAEKAGLDKPFVLVTDLGNYAIGYRVSGMLAEVKWLITARSRLRISILDTLSTSGIEIVSPNFMNQRILEKSERFIPHPVKKTETQRYTPEQVAFDKANKAEKKEDLRREKERLQKEIEELSNGDEDKEGNLSPNEKRERLQRELDRVSGQLDKLEEQMKEEDQD